MSRVPRALVVDEPALTFVPLIEAATAAGLRLGWLDLAERPATALDPIAEGGFLRAVAVDERGSVAVKARRGAPVLGDLLRQHFVGCAAVLVRLGETPPASLGAALESAPRLRCRGLLWSVCVAGRESELDREKLIRALGRPSFWRSPATGASP